VAAYHTSIHNRRAGYRKGDVSGQQGATPDVRGFLLGGV